jgi:hypothetical protein
LKSKLLDRNAGNFLKAMNMQKVFFTLAAIVFSMAASAAPTPVYFEPGSTRVDGIGVAQYKQNHKKKVWVPAHRSHGHRVNGHYIWR